MTEREWPESLTIKDLTTYMTDHERGRLLELWDGAVQAMVDVRSQAKDVAIRELLIAELERLGYTVMPPLSQAKPRRAATGQIPVTDQDRESARALARGFYDVASPEARDRAEEGIAYRIATERAWALKPFRDLEDGYPLGTNVPVYRISRAIEEVER